MILLYPCLYAKLLYTKKNKKKTVAAERPTLEACDHRWKTSTKKLSALSTPLTTEVTDRTRKTSAGKQQHGKLWMLGKVK